MHKTVLEFKNIAKSFGAVKALHDVSFEVREGEILGLLGANGAGKSTLLKIVGGIQSADSGEMLLDGERYAPKDAFAAKSAKVISVYQELNMFCNMTVAENLFLGNEKRSRGGLVDWKTTFAEADRLLESMGLDGINGKDLVETLSVANRQIVEIARAISEKPRILLLDEPTASLSEDQIRWLFAKVRELAAAGTTVIYVSHRLDEVIELCGRCVILRDGALVQELEGEEITRNNIVCAMVGREISAARAVGEREIGDTVFECSELTLEPSFRDVSFSVAAGEILGIAGLVGSGRSELLNSIYGVTPPESGTLSINGKSVKLRHPEDAIKRGIALVSEDRKKEGLFLPETTRMNLSANTLRARAAAGFINFKKERQTTDAVADNVCLDKARMGDAVGKLSGGNQQKVFIGKNLLTDADVLLLDEPTRGVDVGARNEIYSVIKQSAESGKAVVLVSSDWEELTMFADRVVVMSEGRLVGELKGADITQEKMLHLCTEFRTKAAEAPKLTFRDKLRKTVAKDRNSFVLAAMLLLLMVAGPIITEFFYVPANLQNIVWQTFVFILLTIGQLIVVIAGGIDLSISATMTVSCVIGIKLMILFPDQQWLGMLAMLAVGLLIGLFNGLIVVYGRIDAFVATLAVQMMLQGVALIITPKPLSPAPDILKFIANKTFLKLPIILYIGVAIFIIFTIIFKRSRVGRHMYAVGENAEGASWLGLQVRRVKMLAFVGASVMSVMAGYYMLGRSGAAEPSVDTNLSLNSIAYALIGGATLAGGKGSLTGSVLAAFVITVLLNIANHAGVNNYWQQIIRGTVIMVILVVYERRRGEKK